MNVDNKERGLNMLSVESGALCRLCVNRFNRDPWISLIRPFQLQCKAVYFYFLCFNSILHS